MADVAEDQVQNPLGRPQPGEEEKAIRPNEVPTKNGIVAIRSLGGQDFQVIGAKLNRWGFGQQEVGPDVYNRYFAVMAIQTVNGDEPVWGRITNKAELIFATQQFDSPDLTLLHLLNGQINFPPQDAMERFRS